MAFEYGALKKYLLNAVKLEEDGYIGIPVEYGVLFDKERFEMKSGHGGTPIMIYVVNTKITRIGTDTDESIINSMLERGYAVIVLDYFGSDKADTPELDLSVQGLRRKVMSGELFAGIEGFEGKSYSETLVVPSGYNASYGNVYWEFDKHGTDGTLEKIVEIWNNDFRATKGENVILWTDKNGNRKSVQTAHDGSEPVWLDKNGNADENGSYIAVKHTLATKLTDCVKRDGSPIDLKLYMHIVYPTNPAHNVPVMCLAGSSENLCSGSATADRPHMNGFLFSGYAGVLFDYGYTPMARCDHYGYFDGYPMKGYITGDNCTYSMKHYNDHSDTAAMRYLRYLAMSDKKYCFDINAIGVYGNSKGGWMTHLGAKDPNSMPSRRVFPGHHGETRYENGLTQSVDGINGAEEQPWLSYNGQPIFGGANLIYSSCGATWFSVTKGHSPLFVSCNRRDESCFSSSNSMVNLGRIYSIPTMFAEIPLGHTLVHDRDLNYGVDSYKAFFDFCGYWLKHDPVRVTGAKVNAYDFPISVSVRFSGAVDREQAEKITLCDVNGKVLKGEMSPCYGLTEWTFTPDTPVYGDGYVLNVPGDIKGENGKIIDKEYNFDIALGDSAALSLDKEKAEAPIRSDRRYIAFEVENDGVNTVFAYSKDGKAVGSVNTSGKGWYKIELADGYSANDLTLKCEKEAKNIERSYDFKLCKTAVGNTATAPDGSEALAVNGFNMITSYPTEEFYTSPNGAVVCDVFVKDGKLDQNDIGRRFKISFKVYDTVSRYMTAQLNHCSSRVNSIADYNRVIINERTRKGEWTEYTLDYTVYEPKYGEFGMHQKSLRVECSGTGAVDTPIYLKDLKCTEILSNVKIGRVVAVYENGEKPLQLGQSEIECPKSPWSK